MSSKINPTYSGSSFKDWFKTMYGKDYVDGESFHRPTPTDDQNSGMSDVDWDIGQSLFKAYTAGKTADSGYNTSKNAIESAYGSSVENVKDRYNQGVGDLERYYGGVRDSIDKNKAKATAEADRTYELMKKYLPEQLRENGLAGSGFSETTMLGAYSTHANNLGQIEGDYAAARSEADSREASEKGALRSELNADLRNYETEKNTKLSALEAAYLGQNADRELRAGEAVEGIIDKYKADEKADEEKKESTLIDEEKGNLSEMFENMRKENDSEKITKAQYDSLDNYVKDLTNISDKTAFSAILNNYKSYVDNSIVTEKDMYINAGDAENPNNQPVKVYNQVSLKGSKSTANGGKGDNFTLEIGDNEYDVQKSGEYISASSRNHEKLKELYKKKYGGEPGYGAVMVYDGKVYCWLETKLSGGGKGTRWCEIEGRYTDDSGYKNLKSNLGI